MNKLKHIKAAIVICALLLFASCSGQPGNPAQDSNKEYNTKSSNTSGKGTPSMNALSTGELIPGIYAVDSGIARLLNYWAWR